MNTNELYLIDIENNYYNYKTTTKSTTEKCCTKKITGFNSEQNKKKLKFY